MDKIGSDKNSVDTVYNGLISKFGKQDTVKDTIKAVISRIEIDDDGSIDRKQKDLSILAKMFGDKNTVNMANDIKDLLSGNIDEAITKIKRRHTEEYPAVHINPDAKMRNKIVEFIGSHDKCRCTVEELKEFMNNLSEDEEIGKTPNKNYISSNKKLFSKIKVGNNECIKLTGIGKRVYNHLKEKSEQDMNEAKDLSKYKSVNDVLKAVGITGKDAEEISALDLEGAGDQKLYDRIKKATDLETAKNLMGWWGADVEELNEAAQRQDTKVYNGEKYEIWHEVPNGYYAVGLDSMENQIAMTYFDKQDQAEEHAEREIDGFLNEKLIMEYAEVDEEEMARIREIRGSLGGKGSVDFPTYKKEELAEFARIVKELNDETGIEAKLGLSQRGDLIVGFKNDIEQDAGMGYMEKFGEAVNSSEILTPECADCANGEEVEESKKYSTKLIVEAMNLDDFSTVIAALNAGWDYDGIVSEDEDGKFTVTFDNTIPPEVIEMYVENILEADPELVYLSTDGSVAKFEAPISLPETDLNKEVEGIPDDPKKNKRIGGIEFHPPVHNDDDAPAGAQDNPAGTSEAKEEKIGNTKNNKDKKVGDTLDIRQSSSSPPASWIESYEITRIDKNGDIYGKETGTSGHREYTGAEMESLVESKVYIATPTYHAAKGYYGIVINEGFGKNQIEVYNKFNHKVYTGWFNRNQIMESVEEPNTDKKYIKELVEKMKPDVNEKMDDTNWKNIDKIFKSGKNMDKALSDLKKAIDDKDEGAFITAFGKIENDIEQMSDEY